MGSTYVIQLLIKIISLKYKKNLIKSKINVKHKNYIVNNFLYFYKNKSKIPRIHEFYKNLINIYIYFKSIKLRIKKKRIKKRKWCSGNHF